MSIFDEEAGKVDVDGILGESLLSKQFVTPGQYALLLLGNRMTLLGEASDNDATHANNRNNRVFDSQSQFGNKIHWRKLEALYSKTIQKNDPLIKVARGLGIYIGELV